jgi:RND family efflux transporter MFP subunit
MKYQLFILVLLAYLFASCSQNHENENIDEHEEARFQYTAYSNEFELFAEADAFIIGETANVLSHFSILPAFTALEKGKMTLILSVNGTEVRQTLENPTRKGIYSFDIEPKTLGIGHLKFEITTEKGNFEILVPNVFVFASDEEALEAAEKIVVSKTNSTVFTKEQSWKIDFATEFPKIEPFGQVIKTTAQIQSTQGDESIIAAKTNGIVVFTGESVLEGKTISQGQRVFTISGSGMADNNSSVRYAEAKNNYEKKKADYERLKELANDKIVSEKDLLTAKNEYDNSKLIYDNLSNNFSASGQIVTSPMSGFVKQIYVKNGQYVEAGQPIVSVSQNRTLLLRADVQQKYSSILGSVISANIRTVHDNRTYTMQELNGKILSFGKNASIDNYLIPLNLQIDNKGNFISGSFVELYLKTLTNANALTVPNTAIMEEQGNYFVFVQTHPELFEKKEVKLGSSDGLRTEIIKGISATDRIVTKGAILVKLAQSSGALDAHSGHVH